MHPQLQSILDEFESAQTRLHRLASTIPPGVWQQRPRPEHWSIAECVAHLNLTSAAFVPLLRQALREAPAGAQSPPQRYRRDPTGWLLWRMLGSFPRIRFTTKPSFVPQGTLAPATLVTEFDRWQAEQTACVRAAEGLPLDRIRVPSPFDPRVRYNLYACLTILPRHQHRHLGQAEQVWAELHAAG